VENGPGGVFAA